jgi:hypothetical protein
MESPKHKMLLWQLFNMLNSISIWFSCWPVCWVRQLVWDEWYDTKNHNWKTDL